MKQFGKTLKDNKKDQSFNFYPLLVPSDLKKLKRKIIQANFITELSDSPDPHQFAIRVYHIPNKELMDENHIDCGLGKNKKEKNYQYFGAEDFYNSINDHCASLNDINQYQSNYNNKYSFNVIGLSDELKKTNVTYLSNKVRPLSSEEKESIKKDKEKNQLEKIECTTIVHRLDSAQMLYSIQSPSIQFDLRLSEYINPGCLGHLNRNIVLDFIKNNRVTKTVLLNFYQGAL
ncbi:hypothetical protein N9N67_05685 [Bacteriovoracaceae bacterium]|nr:hypothetical protein [Bacteriovoracaceae bacterium]